MSAPATLTAPASRTAPFASTVPAAPAGYADLPGAPEETPAPSARYGHGAYRDPFLDNAKFLLVVLVVIGGNWAPLIHRMRAVMALYLVVNSFLMPALILLCGYFSRHFTGRPEQVRKLAATVLLPYLIFEVLYTVAFAVVGHRSPAVTPLSPTSLCWFLPALFLWRVTSPAWRCVRGPVAVSVAVVISLAAGTTVIHDDLALPRVLQFLPWFVLGLTMTPERFQMLRRPAVRRWGLVAVVGAVMAAWELAPIANPVWLSMRYSHTELHAPLVRYLVARVVLFAVAAALVAAFFAWAPRHRAAFTALGAATMYPYLLHGLVVQAARGYGLYGLVAWAGLLGVAALTIAAVALVVALSSSRVRQAARWLVDPWSLLRLTAWPRICFPRHGCSCHRPVEGGTTDDRW